MYLAFVFHKDRLLRRTLVRLERSAAGSTFAVRSIHDPNDERNATQQAMPLQQKPVTKNFIAYKMAL